jgi:STE24 endopeptidase
MFYSELIVPLFNKQKPLEQGELRSEIETMAERAGFKLTDIYTIDGSKRSTKANAYFAGLGPKKRIVLFDTLINDLSVDEITAVLAHEIGHYKKKHSLTMMLYGILQTGIMLYIFSILAGNESLTRAMGAEIPSFHISALAFILIYSPVSRLISLYMNFLSRKHEYQADSFADETYRGESLISALKKLSVKNLTNLNPHPAYEFVHYSHPPLLKRIANIEKAAGSKLPDSPHKP